MDITKKSRHFIGFQKALSIYNEVQLFLKQINLKFLGINVKEELLVISEIKQLNDTFIGKSKMIYNLFIY